MRENGFDDADLPDETEIRTRLLVALVKANAALAPQILPMLGIPFAAPPAEEAAPVEESPAPANDPPPPAEADRSIPDTQTDAPDNTPDAP